MVRTHAMASSIGWHVAVLGLIVATAIWLAPPPPEEPEVEIDLRRTYTPPPPSEATTPATADETARPTARAAPTDTGAADSRATEPSPIESTSGAEAVGGVGVLEWAGGSPITGSLVSLADPPSAQEQPAIYRSGEAGVSWPRLIPGTDVQPEYPRPARIGRVEGVVELELTIGVDGAVERAEVLRESPTGYGFATAAVQAANQRRYQAAMREGQPVAAKLPVDIEFRLE